MQVLLQTFNNHAKFLLLIPWYEPRIEHQNELLQLRESLVEGHSMVRELHHGVFKVRAEVKNRMEDFQWQFDQVYSQKNHNKAQPIRQKQDS